MRIVLKFLIKVNFHHPGAPHLLRQMRLPVGFVRAETSMAVVRIMRRLTMSHQAAPAVKPRTLKVRAIRMGRV